VYSLYVLLRTQEVSVCIHIYAHLQENILVKNKGMSVSKQRLACVLYSDLRGGMGVSEGREDSSIVRDMHGLWCRFDTLVQEHGMHKVMHSSSACSLAVLMLARLYLLYVCACVYARVCLRELSRLCVCFRSCVHACVRACVRTHVSVVHD
jgi:hypothetical protein